MTKRAAPSPAPASEDPTNEAMRERAYRQLRHLLILQQVPSGKRLRETEWTEKLGVNRSALREAFARLEAQGLIAVGAKTGYLVPPLDRQNIREILAVRIMLETGAIEIICANRLNAPQHFKEMIEACDEIERLNADGDVVRVAEADWRFHNGLIAACQNRRLHSAYEHTPLPLLIPNETSGPVWEAAVRQTMKEHRAILSALLAGDARQAIGLLRGHITERSLVFADNLQK